MATALEQLKTRREGLEALRSELTRLHGYLVRLRCEDPPKGTRTQALVYQAAQIEKLAARSVEFGGTEDGWPDPADAFADNDQITALRQALAEVESGAYPAPLPAGCTFEGGDIRIPEGFNLFEHGRLFNGKLIAFR